MKKLLLSLLLCASLAFGQGVVLAPQTALKTVNGLTTPIASATITVCASNTSGIPCSPALASSTFKDAALTQPLSNPFTADVNGNYQFAIAPGNYTVTVTQLGFSGYSYQITVATPISLAGGLGDPGANGVVYRNGLNTTRPAASADVIALWSGACNVGTVLRGDGSCAAAGAVSSVFTRTGAVVAAANDYTWDQIGAGSNLNAQSMGTGGSFKPLNLGQVAGSQTWLIPGIGIPATAISNTGGNILSNHSITVQISFVDAAGETLASGTSAAVVSASCTAGNQCSVTVTAPTLPTGYTGYTVYANDVTIDALFHKQTATNACVNITINCVITSVTAGAQPLTIGTAYAQPPNVQANNGPAGSVPSIFFQKVDGNNYPWLGMNVVDCDASTGPPPPCGTPVFTHRTYFSDVGRPSAQYPSQFQTFKNAFVSIEHGTGLGTVTTNQDRALGVLIQNPAADSATRWGFEGLQVEADLNGAPTINGSPDGEIAAGSFQLADSHTNAPSAPTAGVQAIRAQAFIEAGAGSFGSCAGTPCISAVRAYLSDLSASGGASNSVAALYARAWNAAGNHTTRQGYGTYIQSPLAAGRFATANYGLYIEPWTVSTNAADRSFMFDGVAGTASKGVVQPALYLGGGMVANQCALCTNILSPSGTTSIPVSGSFHGVAAISTTQLPVLNNTTDFTCAVTGGAGVNYSYGIVGIDGNGQQVNVGTVCTPSANAVLDGSHFVTLSVLGMIYGKGFSRVDICRTASAGTPASTGIIGSFNLTANDVESGIGSNAVQTTFNDTGIAATGSCTTNLTGTVKAFSYWTTTNCSATGSAASPSVAACAAASAGSFSCATNAVTTCTVNTTAVTANSQIFVTQRLDTTTGTRLGVTCNIATNATVPSVNAVVAGTSFSIPLTQPVTNPQCYSYLIVN